MQLAVSHQGSLYWEAIDLTPPWLKTKPVVILSHGIGINCEIWNGWLRHLIPHFRVLRFDSRGYGRSSKHPPGFPWSIDLWADDILAVADAADARQFHLVGESLAGAVSLRLACRDRGERVLSVTTCSSPFRGADLTRVNEWRARLQDQGMAVWSNTMMDQRFWPDGVSAEARQWFATEQQASAPHILTEMADMLLKADLSAELPNLRVPVLILSSDGSPYVTPEISVGLQRIIPGSELRIIPHSRHGIPFSHPDDCAQTFLEFVKRRTKE